MSLITFEDESLRDGLQFEKDVVELEKKVEIFNLLKSAGVNRIQVGSFVHPKIVPQMADTDNFVKKVINTPDVLVTGLALNSRGLDRAKACGLNHVSLSMSASNAHSLKNVRMSRQDALTSTTSLIKEALNSNIEVRAGIQCAFGCIYEGSIDEKVVLSIIEEMIVAGAKEFNIADTTGMANPYQVKSLISKIVKSFPDVAFSLHLHDTRGLAIANMLAGYEAGIKIFDTSVGGLGGCPFVKGAAGNIATEDAVNLFESLGISTGVDLAKLCKVTEKYEEILNKSLPGRMSKVLKIQAECCTK